MPVTAKSQSRSAAICHLDLRVLNVSSQSPSYDQADTATVSYTHCHSHYHYSSLKNPHVSSSKLSISTHWQAGFTLVEIMVVVVILSIFAGMMSLSVGGSESRKNRAFYEHLTDSLSYVRLLSAERMQPMGLSLQANKQGQVSPVIVTLSNPYVAYQTVPVTSATRDSTPKNAMELSADLTTMSGAAGDKAPMPSWEVEPEVSLPELPAGVSLSVQSLDSGNVSNTGQARAMQPWFSNQTVPQVLWFGTGQATPVTIEVRHNSRLVGEVITIMPDGSMSIGQGQ